MKTRYWFKFIVAIHMLVCLGNVTCFFVLPFIEPPWIALPCCTLVFFLTFQREIQCPLTRYENKLRKQMGMREIRGFIGHYILIPIRHRLRERKAKMYHVKSHHFQGLPLNSSSSASSTSFSS